MNPPEWNFTGVAGSRSFLEITRLVIVFGAESNANQVEGRGATSSDNTNTNANAANAASAERNPRRRSGREYRQYRQCRRRQSTRRSAIDESFERAIDNVLAMNVQRAIVQTETQIAGEVVIKKRPRLQSGLVIDVDAEAAPASNTADAATNSATAPNTPPRVIAVPSKRRSNAASTATSTSTAAAAAAAAAPATPVQQAREATNEVVDNSPAINQRRPHDESNDEDRSPRPRPAKRMKRLLTFWRS